MDYTEVINLFKNHGFIVDTSKFDLKKCGVSYINFNYPVGSYWKESVTKLAQISFYKNTNEMVLTFWYFSIHCETNKETLVPKYITTGFNSLDIDSSKWNVPYIETEIYKTLDKLQMAKKEFIRKKILKLKF